MKILTRTKISPPLPPEHYAFSPFRFTTARERRSGLTTTNVEGSQSPRCTALKEGHRCTTATGRSATTGSYSTTVSPLSPTKKRTASAPMRWDIRNFLGSLRRFACCRDLPSAYHLFKGGFVYKKHFYGKFPEACAACGHGGVFFNWNYCVRV